MCSVTGSPAPSTLGTFLRSFSFGHIRQLDKVLAESLRRAWSVGAGPGSEELVVDIDSTICEDYGNKKEALTTGIRRSSATTRSSRRGQPQAKCSTHG